jgi:alpha-L-fucosidase 2
VTADLAPVDWPSFLAQHDMHFTALPQGWQAAPHFGNAMLGSMLYMRDDRLCLEIFRADVCDHRDERYGWTAYSRPHYRVGHFRLETVGTPTGCSWRKDLWHAELTGTLTTDRGDIAIRHLVHAEDMAIVTELTPSAAEADLSWSWHPVAAETTRPGYPTTPEAVALFAKRYGEHYRETLLPPAPNPEGRLVSGVAGSAPCLPPPGQARWAAGDGVSNEGQARWAAGDGVSVWVQDLAAGGQYATAWHDHVEEGTHTLMATIANSYPEGDAGEQAVGDVQRWIDRLVESSAAPSPGPAPDVVASAPVTGPQVGDDLGLLGRWIESHRAWWHAYYPRSFVTIPDESLESLYWQTIYRFGCTSRAGRYYVDTGSIWFQGGQWPYSTHDWNTQSAHWGVYAANRLEQGKELVNRLHANRQNLIDAVLPEAWQEDSAFLHLATAGDFAGTRRSDRRYYDCVGCLPWLLHNAWWQYRFSMDDAMLRATIYPLLRRSINLYLHLVHEEADGRLHLDATYSPETGVFKDANFDLALFKWGCHILLKSCKRLAIDDPLIPRWREVIERLVDFSADAKGFMLGGEQTAWDDHRHLSQLLMIYPLYLVNIEQDGTQDVLARSYELAHNGVGSDGSEELGNLHGMVQTHAGPIGTAIGQGDRALEGLKRLQAELHPNGLWSCGGNPCVESTVSLVNNIQEMLIQSWSDPALDEPGPLRIFPALPSDWLDVEFHDLRTEGAFLVSARRSGGVTEWVRIESLAGEPCRLRVDLASPLRVEGVPNAAVRLLGAGEAAIDLAAGDSVTIYGA